jgi:hypothetical protein
VQSGFTGFNGPDFDAVKAIRQERTTGQIDSGIRQKIDSGIRQTG